MAVACVSLARAGLAAWVWAVGPDDLELTVGCAAKDTKAPVLTGTCAAFEDGDESVVREAAVFEAAAGLLVAVEALAAAGVGVWDPDAWDAVVGAGFGVVAAVVSARAAAGSGLLAGLGVAETPVAIGLALVAAVAVS